MAATVTTTVNDNSLGEITTELLTLSFSVANPLDDRQVLNLATGDNTISIPAATTIVVVYPPATNTQALKQKSTGSDAGEARGANIPWYFPVNGQTTFVLNAAGTVTGLVVHSL
ncbi:MAG TPA: hypothetical protein VKT32_10630 [Chthonomonadaceae bacterium]|nr:hypothetical protein [Chthonomonadaceae bacterium]